MNVLPRLSYLFQCIPIFLTQSFFSKLDLCIREFLWAKKVPRLRIQYLQKSQKMEAWPCPTSSTITGPVILGFLDTGSNLTLTP